MGDADAARALLSAQAVRERAHEMLAAGLRGDLAHFTVDLESLGTAAHVVSELTRISYPDGKVPFHARWRHFVLGGRDLWAERAAQTAWASQAAKARAEFDLAITSVLLDAGAGPSWRYLDPATEQVVARSEGLGVASLRMFEAGAFSADPADPLRADAERLMHLKSDDVAHGMQSMVGNRLVGVEGRAALLASLGAAVAAKPDVFAREDSARPGGLFDHLAAQAEDGRLAAPRILEAVLDASGPHLAEPADARRRAARRHLAASRDQARRRHQRPRADPQAVAVAVLFADRAAAMVRHRGHRHRRPHGAGRIPQWRSVRGLPACCGCAIPKRRSIRTRSDSELVVEWRALTVALLDEVASLIRARQGLTIDDFPLARVLEGGTWAAGRRLARDKRPDGAPPIAVASDGTVF